MNAEALRNVTEALRDRLLAALPSSSSSDVFVGPLDDSDASGAKLILFLYRVVPNASLRNREHIVASGTPPPAALVFRNALPLDLHFLVTVGTNAGGSEEPMLSGLGAAMQALQEDPELAGQKVAYEPVHLSLEGLATDEMSRIWALFPTANYRTSIAYLATPVWIDPPQPAPQAAPVREDSLFAGTTPEPIS
jgi:uncharacterized protein DUF4255